MSKYLVNIETNLDYITEYIKSQRRRFKNIDNETMQTIGYQIAEAIDPYVPYDTDKTTGKHLADYRITSKGNILYDTQYAEAQYYGPDYGWDRDRTMHPDATSMWDEVALSNQEVVDEINEGILQSLILRRKGR